MNTTLKEVEHLEFLQKLGKRVAELRKQKGLTQDDLAALCNWEAPNLRKIEGAKTNPTVKTLLVLAEGLGVSFQDLFDFN